MSGLLASKTRFAMGPGMRVLFAIVAISAFSSALFAAGRAAPDAGKMTLTYDSGKNVKCLTPRWSSGGVPLNINAGSGNASIAGADVPVAGWKSGAFYRIGLDMNGDGIVNSEEYRKVAPSGSVVLTGKVGEKEVSVRCADVLVNYDDKKGEVQSLKWRMQGVYGWVGKIGSVSVRILDENLDGKYGNDGNDAIQIGESKLALPFRGKHRIGDDFYTLKIAPDGSSLEFTKIADTKVGLVRTPFPGKFLIGLVLDGGDGAFDIQACSRTGIPAGTYQVSYGVVGDPRSPAAIFRGRGAVLKYDIQADMKNTLRIGPPMQLVFAADYKKETPKKDDKKDKNNKNKKKPAKGQSQTTHKLSVRAAERVIGAGGEEYGPIKLKAPPVVMILQGGRTLAKTAMKVNPKNGKVDAFTYNLPRNFSSRMAASIKVAMIAPLRGLGNVKGLRTFKQIYDKEQVAPPKTDKPSVSATPWKRPGRPTRVVSKPRPRPPLGGVDPKPKPAPTTRPATGGTVRPPKPVLSDEKKAQRLLKFANSYRSMKLNDKADSMLKQAIEKYPNTEAAAAARKLLAGG
jgi:hypothetical protein